MKKKVVIIVLLVILLSTIGCSRTGKHEAGSSLGDPIQEYDQTKSFQIGDEKDAFSVSEKKIKNENEDIAVLRITNNSDTDYNLTITGKLFDREGNVIFSNDTHFIGFSSGSTNFCVLESGKTYESISYTLSAEPCHNETYLKYCSSGSTTKAYSVAEELKKNGFSIIDDSISCKTLVCCSLGEKMMISGDIWVFSEKWDFLCKKGVGGLMMGDHYLDVQLTTEDNVNSDDEQIPVDLQGELFYIVSIYSISPWDGETQIDD